jgi:HSP20 family molecular chaperone IbpA
MSETQDVTSQAGKAVQAGQEMEYALRPPVDIFEDERGITLLADMPGVSKDRLDVDVDRDSLSIQGSSALEVPQGMEALHADVRSTRYQRSFSLSRELDGENITANLKDGVLTLRIPKREEHQPRKIEVQTG